MGPGYDKCMEQSCIDEIMTAYILHLDKMEELENNSLQLDIWELEAHKIIMEKEKLMIETVIKNVSFLTNDIDEELLEFEDMRETALQIREAELWQIECEFPELCYIEEVNRRPTVAHEKDSRRMDKLNVYMKKRVLSQVTPKDNQLMVRSIYIYLLNYKINKTLKINENFKIGYHDRYITT